MKFSGAFLKSKVARKIALLVFLCTMIPLALMTWIALKNIHQITQKYEKQALVKQSNYYAMSTLSNLVIAKNLILQIANFQQNTPQVLQAPQSQYAIFDSLVYTDHAGKMIYAFRNPDYQLQLPQLIEENLSTLKPEKTQLILLPPDAHHPGTRLLLATAIFHEFRVQSYVFGEINPLFLWGPPSEYPSDINLCAYRFKEQIRTKLFCSNPTEAAQSLIDQENNQGKWELFLRGEFNNYPWIFVTERLTPSSRWHENSLLNRTDFIGVALLSLLITGLFSIRRIRTTMTPLEALTDAAAKLAQGKFTKVRVEDQSEFSELADAFNQMSTNIQQKIETLEAFSAIDSEIATGLDINEITLQVMQRINEMLPDSGIFVLRLEEQTDEEINCLATVLAARLSSTSKIILPLQEIHKMQKLRSGQWIKPQKEFTSLTQKLLKTYRYSHFQVYPMIWQQQINGILILGTNKEHRINEDTQQELIELARRISLATSAVEREQLLIRQSQHDSLTDLPNRILLQDRLEQAIEYASRHGVQIWVLFIDLDHFKIINDSLGHHAGDNLLTIIAKRLLTCVRESDTVARFGGDEFVMVLNVGQEESSSIDVLDRIIQSVAEPVSLDNQTLQITCSIGIAVYPNDSTKADHLIKYADIAMYRAKEVGKNNFQFFTQSMNETTETRMKVFGRLRMALEKNEFLLLYQPKVDMSRNQIVGTEVLIRWNSPDLGMVAPMDFIPLAEETGLIVPIGEWVLRTACQQVAAWHGEGAQALSLSVNVSARQFAAEGFPQLIATILEETGLPPHLLDLELTESLLFSQTSRSIDILNEIKKLGVTISIDDFGTGYSNLSYLNKLPIDTLKIDKSFIDEISSEFTIVPVVDSIISLARNLHLNIVAEGVESLPQIEYLASKGCHTIQGYYFSKPVRADIMFKMLQPQT